MKKGKYPFFIPEGVKYGGDEVNDLLEIWGLKPDQPEPFTFRLVFSSGKKLIYFWRQSRLEIGDEELPGLIDLGVREDKLIFWGIKGGLEVDREGDFLLFKANDFF